MFKRSRGYFLLTMLVLTGLAGRSHTDNLSAKERRFLLNDLKLHRSLILDNFKGLSKSQLDFYLQQKNNSLKNVLFELTTTQDVLWNKLLASLNHPAAGDKNETSLSDQQLLVWTQTHLQKMTYSLPNQMQLPSFDYALKHFKKDNNAILRCVRTATGNLKGSIIETPAGKLNALQTIRLIDGYIVCSLQKIGQIKHATNFPQ